MSYHLFPLLHLQRNSIWSDAEIAPLFSAEMGSMTCTCPSLLPTSTLYSEQPSLRLPTKTQQLCWHDKERSEHSNDTPWSCIKQPPPLCASTKKSSHVTRPLYLSHCSGCCCFVVLLHYFVLPPYCTFSTNSFSPPLGSVRHHPLHLSSTSSSSPCWPTSDKRCHPGALGSV